MHVPLGNLETTAALGSGHDELFALLARHLAQAVHGGLLTILAPNDSGTRLIRCYSNRPDQFPLDGGDDVEDNRWFQHIFRDKQPVIANDDEEIREWLPGFTNAKSLGYESLLNFPIVMAGEVVGLINIMARRGHFDKRRLEVVEELAPLAALALAARSRRLPTIRLHGG